jgi:uncharacterized membrane protein
MGNILLIVFMLATVVALVVGIFLMATGGARNTKYGNKVMWSRVYLQGAALVVLAALFMLKDSA